MCLGFLLLMFLASLRSKRERVYYLSPCIPTFIDSNCATQFHCFHIWTYFNTDQKNVCLHRIQTTRMWSNVMKSWRVFCWASLRLSYVSFLRWSSSTSPKSRSDFSVQVEVHISPHSNLFPEKHFYNSRYLMLSETISWVIVVSVSSFYVVFYFKSNPFYLLFNMIL